VPEGHTIHRLARDHASWFAGEPCTSARRRAGSRTPPRCSTAACSRATDAYGKHLFHRYEGPDRAHPPGAVRAVLRPRRTPPPEPRDTCATGSSAADRTIDLVGATACELLTPTRWTAIVATGSVPTRSAPTPTPTGPTPPCSDARRDRSGADGPEGARRGRQRLPRRGAVRPRPPPERPARDVGPRASSGTRCGRPWSSGCGAGCASGASSRSTRRDRRPGQPDARERATYVYKQEHCKRCGARSGAGTSPAGGPTPARPASHDPTGDERRVTGGAA
jgi:hypothetical protein